MKKLIGLVSLVALFNLNAALACGDKECDQCAKQSPKSAHVTKSGRKVKCSKCAETEAKAEKPADEKTTDGSEPAKT